MKTTLIITIIVLSIFHAQGEAPAELILLQEQRDQKVAEIDRIYVQKLEELKLKYTKAGRLEDALSVDDIIKNLTSNTHGQKEDLETKQLLKFLSGTKWIGQGGNGNSIEFVDGDTFLSRRNDRGSGKRHKYSVAGSLLYLHWTGHRGAPCKLAKDKKSFVEKGKTTWKLKVK